MSGRRAGPSLAAALSILLAAGTALGDALVVETSDGPVLSFPAPEGAEWRLSWRHSVTGGAVADCFVNEEGRMTLARSYLHDFAAGLGEVAGRGALRPAEGGGYWIENIDEPIPDNALVLRVGGPAVDHRLRIGGEERSLSALAAGRRVTLRLTSEASDPDPSRRGSTAAFQEAERPVRRDPAIKSRNDGDESTPSTAGMTR